MILTLSLLMLVAVPVWAELILADRVVAFVDETAITLSEFNRFHKTTPETTKDQAIRVMINRLLLKKEALKFKLTGTDDELIQQYIDLKIKSLVIIKNEDIERFYKEHKGDFKGTEIEDVREDIENLLIGEEVNKRLDSSLQELAEKAYVRIQF
ncbi:MAG: hypothetical protein HQL05_07900 [Nitrospirae bacterium]|uniref:hypothetical protein n=1 Tax=Candidatus Magnetobacterium casense TaxID=1455061 RepID=UPI0012DF07F9|nr:hypothetical protein [Candidatus Magnetobacterium casensis]MBF0337741.1 hypothetical protein [Nitrospirota bacterium]